MQRFNSFNMIHKALRAMLYDAALTLQQTSFTDAADASSAIEKIETVVKAFENHAEHEDHFMLPAINAFAPEVVDEFEQEHTADMELGNRLVSITNMFGAAGLDEEKQVCGSALNKAFRDFMVFNLEHMAKEEIKINKVLWDNYTDIQLIQLNERLTASVPLEEKMSIAKWMLRAVNKTEAIEWLKAVKEKAPDFVFQALFDLTETELPENIRAEVQDAVMEDELIF